MHKKSNKAFFISLIALLVVAQTICFASPSGPDTTEVAKARLEQKRAALRKAVGYSPFDLFFAPGLEKHFAHGSASRAPQGAVNSPASFASTTPNFGGFLSAPLFNTELHTACVTDPYNCGVGIAVNGDFDKDGKPDIATLEYDGTLNILLNDGPRGLKLPMAYGMLTAAANSFSIASAQMTDVNNDGYPDVVALDLSGNHFLVYVNQRDGSFAEPVVVASRADGSIGSMAVGDVNHDGKVDVVIISYYSVNYTWSKMTVQTFLGNGDGTFASPTAALTTINHVRAFTEIEPNGLTLADVNHDGSLDLISVLENRTSQNTGQITVSVTLGNNSGAFSGFSPSLPVMVVNTYDGFRLFMTSGGIYAVDLNKRRDTRSCTLGSVRDFHRARQW